jgi:hypothetical protein
MTACLVCGVADVTKTRLMLGHDKNGKAYSGCVGQHRIARLLRPVGLLGVVT